MYRMLNNITPLLFTRLIRRRLISLLVLLAVTPLPDCLEAQTPAASFAGSAGVAIWNGTVYVSDTKANVVMARDSGSDQFYEFVKDARIQSPRGLAIDADFLYIADPAAHQVFRINRQTKEVSPLLPPNPAVAPIDLVSIPSFVRANDKLSMLPTLAVLDAMSKAVFILAPYSPSSYFDSSSIGNRRFQDPRSISQFYGNLLVTDSAAGAIFEAKSSLSSWDDIRRSSMSLIPPRGPERGGIFFQQMTHPESAVGYLNFVYVIDNHKLYAYLPDKNHLVSLVNTKIPLSNPDRVIVNPDADELLLVGQSLQDYRSWPLLLPMTVEVEAGGDVSTPLAALYTYLWHRGALPVVKVTLPATSQSGESCEKPACLVEKVRGLLPKTNSLMEALLCDMNPSLCIDNKMRNFTSGATVVVPDVPFEPYLSPEIRIFDGKRSIRSYLSQLVPDHSLLVSVTDAYLRDFNPAIDGNLDMAPTKGVELRVPVQHNRYYLSVEKSELLSSNSGIALLVKTYPALSIRPYGTSQKASAQASAQSDIAVRDPAELAVLEKALLKNINFNQDRALKYGRANDVPILIAEPTLDCQHPAFFGTGGDDSAFTGGHCAPPESGPVLSYVGWTMTAGHHGTCVASIIGARSAPYGSALASGADLSAIDNGAIDVGTLQRFYSRERQPFIVNISSGDPAVTAENTWRNLFNNPFVRNDVLFVAAADNDDSLLSKKQKFPAMLANEFANVISVGALDKTGQDIWEDKTNKEGSNTGEKVELLAPGEAVPCAIEVSQGQSLYSAPPGTSFATPIVSAAAALLLDKRLSPTEVKARLLATADPIDKQRQNEPLAKFGRINLDHALLNPKMSHFEFLQQGTVTHLDADMLDGSRLDFEDPNAAVAAWKATTVNELLSIRRTGSDETGNGLYRLVYFDNSIPPGTVVLKEDVLLNGCLQAQSRQSGEDYIFVFEAGCAEASALPDQSKVISDMQLLIAPTLGEFRK
jgi:hypothetical protein